ncbi:MAG TPA: hypothetical protein VNK43_00860 [Gemmatimonadales bacterium]|nr:hypothetical protein [Gemmatimonadales bacterium]
METRITAHSQTYRLRQRIEEAQIRHGQEVRADLPFVRVIASWAPFAWLRRARGEETREGHVFFCEMGQIRVRQVVANGDDHPLPSDVIIEGLKVPDSGTYDILDAVIRSNGDIRLIVDERTRVVPTAERMRAVDPALV